MSAYLTALTVWILYYLLWTFILSRLENKVDNLMLMVITVSALTTNEIIKVLV